ncbi:hypothetical protein [Bremerella cremea]|uniref:hypothetical protein n=1 Tax=Bremerella cremea TaxID=1031537 RepID=UPI0011C0687D|nr:hypothetical protein [Bremerella cremea]
MRSNIINIRANIAAVVARVNAVVVDVIRSASATGLRLYGHTWQTQYGQTWFKPTTLKPSDCLVPCLALRCLGGGLSSTGMPMSLSMRFQNEESLGRIPRS